MTPAQARPGPDLPGSGATLTLIVTRPQPQADEWVARLASLGQPAVALPLLVIEPSERFSAAVHAAWSELADCRLVMFVSPNAVLQFFAGRPAEIAWPAGTLAAATGPGTVAALLGCGVASASILAPDEGSSRFDAEALWTQRLQGRDWSGAKVCIVRGEEGRDWLADTLRDAGATVRLLAAYRRAAPQWTPGLLDVLHRVALQPQRHAWLFSSSEAIRHLSRHIESDESGAGGAWRALCDAPALATHPRIAETARACGWREVRELVPDAQAIVAAARVLEHRARLAPG